MDGIAHYVEDDGFIRHFYQLTYTMHGEKTISKLHR
jgi:hypothetical protein